MTTTLIIDEKVTIWRRSEVVVNIADLEKAKAEGTLKDFIAMASFNYRDSELLTETEDTLTPEDNGGQPTIEVYNDSMLDGIIYTNTL
jgi:hypothetical protein